MPHWNPGLFLDSLRQRHGDAIADQAQLHLNSVHWKLVMSRYHMDEMNALMQSLGTGAEASALIAGAWVNGISPENYDRTTLGAEAHLIASAQSLHSTQDIMGQVIWHALRLESRISKNIEPRDRYLAKIYGRMKGDRIAGSVTKAIDCMNADRVLIATGEIDEPTTNRVERLKRFVNVTKHESLVPTSHRVDFREGVQHLCIRRFETWAECWADDFLEASYDAMTNHLSTIGEELEEEIERDD